MKKWFLKCLIEMFNFIVNNIDLQEYVSLYPLWEKILSEIKYMGDINIEGDEELYVVYTTIDDNFYICKNGKHAIQLYNQMNKLNLLLNVIDKPILYGKVEAVFRHKIPFISKIVFTYDISREEQRKICKYIADIPLIK